MRSVEIRGTNIDEIPRPLVAVGLDEVTYRYELPEHHHRKCELIYTVRGVLTCEADGHLWIIPPQCAHLDTIERSPSLPRIRAASNVMRCSSIRCRMRDWLPRAAQSRFPRCCASCCFAFVMFPPLYSMNGPEARLLPVVLDELSAAREKRICVCHCPPIQVYDA